MKINQLMPIMFMVMGILTSAMLKAEVTKTNVLYKCYFSETENENAYQSDASLIYNEKTWNVSSYKCVADEGFFLGGKQSSSYSIDSEMFGDIKEACTATEIEVSDGKIFALQLKEQFEKVTKVTFVWNGIGGTAGDVNVYLFVDNGSGYKYETNITTSSEGSISKTYTDENVEVKRVALVCRPKAKGRQLKLTSFEIDGEKIPVESLATPEFSLSNENPVWEGTKLSISSSEEIEGLSINYTINDGADISAAAPAEISIDETMTISAKCKAEDLASEEVQNKYVVMDLNGDFSSFDGDFPNNWGNGNISKKNVSYNAEDGYLSLQASTTTTARLTTVSFVVDPGTYDISAYGRLANKIAEGEANELSLQYVLGTSSSYSTLSKVDTYSSEWTKMEGQLVLTKQSLVRICFALSKKETENWTAYVKDVDMKLHVDEETETNIKLAKQALPIKVVGQKVVARCAKGAKVRVYDMQGQCLLQEVAKTESVEISGLPCGKILIVTIDGKASKVIL